MSRRPPRSTRTDTLFPYTTRFRSAAVLLVWLVAPVIGWWISKPLAPPAADLTADERIFLRSLARRTWRYFAQCVAPLDNWLPPDNFQDRKSTRLNSSH